MSLLCYNGPAAKAIGPTLHYGKMPKAGPFLKAHMASTRTNSNNKTNGIMSTIVYESQEVDIPAWVVDLPSFRRWTDQEDFPENGRIWFLRGKVWVDMSKEQLFTHLQVKDEFTRVLRALIETEQLGWYFSDGLFLTNVSADISGKPDGTFISHRSLQEERARFLEGADQGFTEVEGSPDMVLEVVSQSSVRKDTVVLQEAYWEAGIEEYWLVDARKDPLQFNLFRQGPKGYVSARKQSGWIKSGVFGKWFRLSQKKGPQGYPQYTLSMR